MEKFKSFEAFSTGDNKISGSLFVIGLIGTCKDNGIAAEAVCTAGVMTIELAQRVGTGKDNGIAFLF